MYKEMMDSIGMIQSIDPELGLSLIHISEPTRH